MNKISDNTNSLPIKQINQTKLDKNNTLMDRSLPFSQDNKNINFNTSVIPITQINLMKSVNRIISFQEAILPKCCSQISSVKYEFDSFSKIVRSKISTDGLLKLFQEIENIKHLILDEKQLILFDYMKNLTHQEHLNKIDIKFTMNHSEILNILNILKTSDTPLNRTLMGKIVC